MLCSLASPNTQESSSSTSTWLKVFNKPRSVHPMKTSVSEVAHPPKALYGHERVLNLNPSCTV
jgi:hypothetical protein